MGRATNRTRGLPEDNPSTAEDPRETLVDPDILAFFMENKHVIPAGDQPGGPSLPVAGALLRAGRTGRGR